VEETAVAVDRRGDGPEPVPVLADRALALVRGEEASEGGLVGRVRERVEEELLRERGVVEVAVGRDDMPARPEAGGTEGSVVVEAEALGVRDRDEVEAGRRPLAEAPLDERLDSAELAAAEGLEGEEPARAEAGAAGGRPAVRHGDEEAVPVEAEPGAAGLEVAAGDEAGLDLRGRGGGTAEELVAVGGDDEPAIQDHRQDAHVESIIGEVGEKNR
jgi:hypothetical protein